MKKKIDLNTQEFHRFTEEESKTWNLLFNRLDLCRRNMAYSLFEQGVHELGIYHQRHKD
jgi:phenylalanine-4-hydroxylase